MDWRIAGQTRLGAGAGRASGSSLRIWMGVIGLGAKLLS